MILELDRFQAPEPYPKVRHVLPDKKLAATLMEAYAGEYSELTTVLQYGYHSLRCQRRYSEVARVMRGIFYVETLHLEYLGDLILKLGVDPRYNLALREKAVCWQGDLVEYGESPAKMLLADLDGEKGAAAFYTETAAKTDQPEVAALLSRLARDEELHVHMLTDLYRRNFRR